MVPQAVVLLPQLLAYAGLFGNLVREPVRVWAHSGVERLWFPGHVSVIFKYADAPFDREHIVLKLLERQGIPVPRVHAVETMSGGLAMLMDDLGDPLGTASDDIGAKAAARLHAVNLRKDDAELPVLDGARLAVMPNYIAASLARLGLTEDERIARTIALAARSRLEGVTMAPFSLCHSEYHPSSVHIGSQGWHLLDFARAFIGSGLLDLASWYGTIDEPDTDRLSNLIERYICAGGHTTAASKRGGLDAASWALGWHRIWITYWYLQQIDMGWAKGNEQTWITTITRHLGEAANLLHI